MQLTRTTVRLRPQLKKAAEKEAVEMDITFQSLLERALESYLKQKSRYKAQKLVFKARDLGVSLDQLDRETIYVD